MTNRDTVHYAFLAVLLVPLWSAIAQAERNPSHVAILYSYFEKDKTQLSNFQFFLTHGIGSSQQYPLLRKTEVVIVNNGYMCSPCSGLPIYNEQHRCCITSESTYEDGVYTCTVLAFLRDGSEMWAGERLTLIFRRENVGMDFAAHNVSLDYLASQNKRFKYYIFLNSSVRGPFYPSYMPAGWEWTQAYTARLTGRVKVVSSSLVCLPSLDKSGGGPRVESWAFALDEEGLGLTVDAGVFEVRKCKLCRDGGIVTQSEYGISRAILEKNYNLATLMSMYRSDVDWSDPQHWACNGNAHPSRHGTYDGISMHPFETVFVKASWRVGEPHLSKYTKWFLAHAAGSANTAGLFDEKLYYYAVSLSAQDPPPVERCFALPV